MVGHPKYERGDKVEFKLGNKTYSGTIEIIDAYGVFENNSDVHYDIMGTYEGEPTLFKHIKETSITQKIVDIKPVSGSTTVWH